MLCKFKRVIYPSTPNPGSYMVAIYHPCEKVRGLDGKELSQVTAVGYCLPTAENLRFEMEGRWRKNAKYGYQFEMESYNEVLVPTKAGVIAYLSSGQIKGIGPKMAGRIYDAFGLNALDVLDREPEKLLEIKGISENTLKKIMESYTMNRGARDVIAFLAPHGVTPRQAVKFYEEYKEKTMDIVKNHPYQLCEMVGIGFLTADKIAAKMGMDRLSTERVDEGLLYTLTEAEGSGHLCMEKHDFLKAALKLLDTPNLTFNMAAHRAARLVENGQLTTYDRYVYRPRTAHAESHLAQRIVRFLRTPVCSCTNLDVELDAAEKRLRLRFAPEQRQAVKMALSHGLSVITGGPGTGKTMIQRAILDIYRRQNPDKNICCCAPTGRAARRMEQSIGHPASTVHKALNLMADEDGNYNEPELLDADLILVDEVSMLDIYMVNPPAPGKFEVSHGKRVFRMGDKVMQTRNSGEVTNGDIGYITDIYRSDDGTTIRVDFGDGREVEYDSSELSKLNWGYASTVHKSQGSEYQSVIINLQNAHYIMLTRPLVYTAITRGKTKVILVGEKRALHTAINRTDTEKRGTCLAQRIQNN